MSAYVLDAAELRSRLDAKRKTRGISWRQVCRENDISPCVPSRLKNGTAPDAHALLSLLVWLDLDTDIAYLIKPKGAA